MKLITICHVNKAKSIRGYEQVYCGRKCYGYSGSALGNPEVADKSKPGATLPGYRRWLWDLMQNPDSDQMQELRRIHQIAQGQPVMLTCWCHDDSTCHCSIIRKAVEWLDSQKG